MHGFQSRLAHVLRVFTFACVASLSVTVSAETLNQSLLSAYRKNPQLDAERSSLRATDETVNQARANYRPLLAASGAASVQESKTTFDRPNVSFFPDGTSYPAEYSVTLNQQIFRGFRTRNATNKAEANVLAGREALRATEQTVLFNAIQAFMNVVRDTAIVKLRDNNVRVLSRDLRATQDRFSVGEVTRTDVAQSRARRAQAVSDLELARANLKSSRANYQQVVGYSPRRLQEPKIPNYLLPKSLAEIRKRAEQESPNVVGALYNEQAALYNVKEISGEFLPTFEIDATYNSAYRGGGDNTTQHSQTGIVTGTLTVPLYQRGAVSSRVRQAKHQHVQQMKLVEQARNEARETAISAWAQLSASRAQLRSTTSQVEANGIALSGVREEEKVGQRTLLDVLDAEQELLNSQVSLVSNRRDLIVNAYNVLAAIGRLTAKDLRLTSKAYDPKANYGKVRRKWFGISITHADGKTEHLRAEDRPFK